MNNFVHGRRIAMQRTTDAHSAALLSECFPDLMAVDDSIEPAYRDRHITGPIFATWKEAMLLHWLVRLAKPSKVVEIGCSIGWTSAHMLTAMPDNATLCCIDPFTETARGLDVHNQRAQDKWHENMDRVPRGNVGVHLHVGESPAILPEVAEGGLFDFVFLDGWHLDGQPLRDVRGLLPHMAEHAIVVLHDLVIPDVMEAGRELAQNGYYFTGFISRHHLGVFIRGASPDKMPRWWKRFLKVSAQIYEAE